MKRYLFILLFCKMELARPASPDTLNQVDPSTGLKQGYWIVYNNLKKLPAYPANAKVEEGSFSNSKKIGIWKTYFPGGSVKSEITYTNNRPGGIARMYYENGKLQEEGVWENNRWVGDYKSYYENGQLFYDFNYSNSGKREGEQKYYYANGQLMMKGDMRDGKESGTWEEHYENGDLKEKRVFNDGELDAGKTKVYASREPAPRKEEQASGGEPAKPIDSAKEKVNDAQPPFNGDGYAKLFNMNKQISKVGEFKKFRLINGKDYLYSRDGILEKIAVYKDGKYVGEAPIEQTDRE